jgi:hypothetical protein
MRQGESPNLEGCSHNITHDATEDDGRFAADGGFRKSCTHGIVFNSCFQFRSFAKFGRTEEFALASIRSSPD